MSKFWGDESSSEDEAPKQVVDTVQVSSRHKTVLDDESSSEDEKRVVKSAKDKRFEQMQRHIKAAKNAININDWNSIFTGYIFSHSYFSHFFSHISPISLNIILQRLKA